MVKWRCKPTPSDKNIIMLQLKPPKQYIHYKNGQLDLQDEYDINVAFSTILPSLRSSETTIWIF